MNKAACVLAIVLLSSFGPAGFAGSGADNGNLADSNSAAHAINRAEEVRKRAAKAGAEWLETESLIEQARLAAGKEDWNSALRLANTARRQSELALEQARRESEAWKRRVVR